MRIRKNNDNINQEEVELIAGCSDALAHPARVEIFHYIYTENLSRRTVCNKDLVAAFDYSQATISQHASKIAQSGLIDVQKKDNRSYYFVNIGVLGKYLNAVRKLNEV